MSQTCASSIHDFCGAFDYCAPNFVFGEIEEIIIAQLYTYSGYHYPEEWDWEKEASWNGFLSGCDDETPETIAFRIHVRATIDDPDRP